MFKLDLIINNNIVSHSLCLFKYIHPNIITLTGLVINFIIFSLYFQDSHCKIINSILIFLRILADNLDGMVARKYKKTSNIGGFLDTLSDTILTIMTMYAITFYFIPSYALYFAILFGIITISYLFYYDAICVHANFMEKNNNGIINIIPVFLGYNTYITCFTLIILLWLS